MRKIGFLLAVVFAAVASTPGARLRAPQTGQAHNNQKCSIPFYPGKQVDKKARMIAKPQPDFDTSDRRKHAYEVILLKAVLCGSGEVTDIEVQNGPSDSANAKAIEAARRIRFIPAEKDGEKVSTLVNLKYHVNR